MPQMLVDDWDDPLPPDASFDTWFKRFDWWKENSRREDLEPVWNSLREMYELPPKEIAGVLERVIFAIADEYGD